MKLILASQSKGRKQLLELFKIPFSIMPSKLDEDKILGQTPLETIQLRARLKGEEIAARIIASSENPTRITNTDPRSISLSLILSADSEAIMKGKTLGKAENEKEAKEILGMLSGKTHEFITAIYAIRLYKSPQTTTYQRKVWAVYDRSYVTMKKLTKEDMRLHLKLSEYKRYAGAYALFASPIDIITKVEGSLTNVVGLPLEKIVPILSENHLLEL